MSVDSASTDSAAIFATAHSLWRACLLAAERTSVNLSDCYSGMDGLMREVMRVAELFEAWACSHVDFASLNDVWPYLLQDRFGEACLEVIRPAALAEFNEQDCLRVALRLRVPIAHDEHLPLPLDIVASNPVAGSPFVWLRIQTMRMAPEDDTCVPFTLEDDPFHDELGTPFFSLFGVGSDGLCEHIADRKTYGHAAELAGKIAPGVAFPATPLSMSV